MYTTYYSFGRVYIEESLYGDDNIKVTLNFSLGLGNNFSYQHYIDALKGGEGLAGAPEDLLEYLSQSITIGDDVTIVDSAGKMLCTCGSDLADHLR